MHCITFKCTTVIRQLYNLWSNQPDKSSSTYLIPYVVITMCVFFFSTFPMLYFPALWLLLLLTIFTFKNYSCSSTVVSIFTPPCTSELLVLSICPLHMFLDGSSPIIPCLLSGYCPFVLYFNVSGCILLACLF